MAVCVPVLSPTSNNLRPTRSVAHRSYRRTVLYNEGPAVTYFTFIEFVSCREIVKMRVMHTRAYMFYRRKECLHGNSPTIFVVYNFMVHIVHECTYFELIKFDTLSTPAVNRN